MKNDDLQDHTNPAVPSDLSDHDERDEMLAVEKHWDDEKDDALAKAEQRLDEFQSEHVPLSEEDWEHEEELDDELPDHINEVIDESLEQEQQEDSELV